MIKTCSKFTHFDEVYRTPDRMYLSNRNPDKRLCMSCGLLRGEHPVRPSDEELAPGLKAYREGRMTLWNEDEEKETD